jgi:hypothetical protein
VKTAKQNNKLIQNFMKKNANFYLRTAAMLSMAVVMFFGAALFTGCEDKDEEPQVTPSLVVSPKTIPGVAAGGDYTIQVVANVAWTASVTAGSDFITLVSASGTGDGSFTVALAEFNNGESRTGTITVTGEGLTETVTVNQSGSLWSLVVDPTEFTDLAASPATILTVTVTANVPWTAVGQDPGDGTNGHFPLVWNIEEIDPPGAGSYSSTGSGTFSVYIPANPGLESRSGTVTVTGTGDGAGLSQVITFIQLAMSPPVSASVSPLELHDAPKAGATAPVLLVFSAPWTAEASGTGVSVSPTSGTGGTNETLTVTIDENSSTELRTGSIAVSAGDLTFTIPVSQRGVEPEEMEYIEFNNLKWAKYNQGFAGKIPSTVTYGGVFPVSQINDDLCPDGWRLPAKDEWVTNNASVRSAENSVNGFYMDGNGNDPTFSTHLFIPFINYRPDESTYQDTGSGKDGKVVIVHTQYATSNAITNLQEAIRINPWDNGVDPQKFWFGQSWGDGVPMGETYGYHVRCVQDVE